MVNQINDAIALVEQHLDLLRSRTDIGVYEEFDRWESALYVLRSLNALVDAGFLRWEARHGPF